MNRRHLPLAAAAVAALGLAAAGCTAAPEQPNGSNTVTTSEAPLNGGNPTPDTVTDYPPEPSYVELALGETYTYDDGVSVTISQYGTGTSTDLPGVEEAIPLGTLYPVIEYTVTNGSSEPITPNPFGLAATFGETGEPASTVYDDQSTGGIANTTMILPGATATNRIGLYAPETGPYTIQYAPTYDHSPIFYTRR